MSETIKIKGLLKGTEFKPGKKKDGEEYIRTKMTIESEGNTVSISTFDQADKITIMNAAGNEIECEYTETTKGEYTYKNLVKGSLKVVGQGEAPIVDSESINEEASLKKPASNKDFKTQSDYQEKEKDKFDLGMAKNGAIEVICASMKATGKVWGKDTDETYKSLVKRIFKLNKELRKELLGK